MNFTKILQYCTFNNATNSSRTIKTKHTFLLRNSLGLSALKTATQVKGQHKYLNDCLKKSNICVEEHPSVSKHSLRGDCRRGKGNVRGIENIDKDKYRTSTQLAGAKRFEDRDSSQRTAQVSK